MKILLDKYLDTVSGGCDSDGGEVFTDHIDPDWIVDTASTCALPELCVAGGSSLKPPVVIDPSEVAVDPPERGDGFFVTDWFRPQEPFGPIQMLSNARGRPRPPAR